MNILSNMNAALEARFSKNVALREATPQFVNVRLTNHAVMFGKGISSRRDVPELDVVMEALDLFERSGGRNVVIDLPNSKATWVIEPHEVI